MDNLEAPAGHPAQGVWLRCWPWLLVLAALFFVGMVRFRLLDVSLERDEGEYAYAGQLLLQGIPPYDLVYSMKLPGTSFVYMLGMAAFGQTTAGIHLTLMVANSLTIIFVFLLGRRLAGSLAGALAALSYGVMSLSPGVAGLAAHATHFVVLFAVPAAWLLLKVGGAGHRGTLFASGLLFGMAFLMKQQGGCFAMFGLVFLAWNAWSSRDLFSTVFVQRMLVFGTGLALPFALTCAGLACAGVFGRFWFWTISYARLYENALTLREGFHDHLLGHLNLTRDFSIGFWLLGLAGLLAGCRAKALRPAMAFVVGLWLASFLGTAAGLYFRGHYFILLLPAFALLLGIGVEALRKIAPTAIVPNVFKSLPVIAFGAILSWMIYYYAPLYFQWPMERVYQVLYRENPFMEAVAAGAAIREHSDSAARVAVIGSEPEIYFYAGRHSATGYIYTYPLMEPQPYAQVMQREMAREIESAQPEFLVQVPNPASWLEQPGSSHYLIDWFQDYARQFYHPVGVIGRFSDGQLLSCWGEAATNGPAPEGEYLTIYQRRTEVGISPAAN